MARTMTALVTLLLAAIPPAQTKTEHLVARIASAQQQQLPVAPTPAIPQTSQQPAEPCAPGTVATVGIDSTTALLLLDRIQTVLDEAVKGESPTSLTAVGTSGAKEPKAADGRIRIDRSLVDEIRAELAQVRTLLKK
jgi:hypothetical protein